MDGQEMNKRILLISLVLLVLVGCATQEYTNEDSGIDSIYLGKIKSGSYANYIERFIDSEAGVVCWVVVEFRGGGISCLPLDQTNLSKE